MGIMKFALAKFDELWAQAVEVSEKYVQTIELQVAVLGRSRPYELFLKFSYTRNILTVESSRAEEDQIPRTFRRVSRS